MSSDTSNTAKAKGSVVQARDVHGPVITGDNATVITGVMTGDINQTIKSPTKKSKKQR